MRVALCLAITACFACTTPGDTSRTDAAEADAMDSDLDASAPDANVPDGTDVTDVGTPDALDSGSDASDVPDALLDAAADAVADAVADAMPDAPEGATCRHSTGGGLYGHTACSEGFQCCDGTWRPRDSGCGVCICVEPTGTTGCGASTMPPDGDVHAGLTQTGSEIPRRGLRNPTGGVGVEPEGVVVTEGGREWVRGTISQFGGPRDTGVSPTETGAITGERLRSLNTPLDASRAEIESRPGDFYYAAMRFNYSPGDRSFWRDARLLVRNPANGRQVVVRPVDWGPHTRTGRIIDVAPQTERDLGAATDDEVDVAFARPGTPLGPVE